MNFLAHLCLSEPTAAGWIGGLLPDLVRGGGRRGVAEALRPAVRLHHRVDAFTDTHPIPARTRGRLAPRHGRYSGILADMLYDHVLARDWSRHHDEPLSAFIERVYACFERERDGALMPEPMRPIVARMIEQDWLGCYASEAGMREVLGRMERRFAARFGRAVSLRAVMDGWAELDAAVTADFESFWPRLVEHVDKACVVPRDLSSESAGSSMPRRDTGP